MVRLQIEYEWKPIKCHHCRIYGHKDEECRKKPNVRKEWRRKPAQPIQEREEADLSNIHRNQAAAAVTKTQAPSMDNEGFITVLRPSTRQFNALRITTETVKDPNHFDSLQEIQEGPSFDQHPKGSFPNV